VAILETSPGVTDLVVLERARNEQRTLLTFDRDYGELIYLKRLPVPLAIIYLRFVPTSPEDAVQQVAPLLTNEGRLVQGYFVVMDRDSYRRRPLPETVV
jgi:predicted nuclease of predicted toxin-antitoxin system